MYYGKVASAKNKTIYVECTEETNEINGKKIIIWKRKKERKIDDR